MWMNHGQIQWRKFTIGYPKDCHRCNFRSMGYTYSYPQFLAYGISCLHFTGVCQKKNPQHALSVSSETSIFNCLSIALYRTESRERDRMGGYIGTGMPYWQFLLQRRYAVHMQGSSVTKIPNCYSGSKYSTFLKLKMHQNSFSAGALPQTLLRGTYGAPLYPLISWKKSTPPHSAILDSFSISIDSTSAFFYKLNTDTNALLKHGRKPYVPEVSPDNDAKNPRDITLTLLALEQRPITNNSVSVIYPKRHQTTTLSIPVTLCWHRWHLYWQLTMTRTLEAGTVAIGRHHLPLVWHAQTCAQI